ncbi:MAG TPA: hypothetical protein VIM02_16590 [Rhizomicrobium sp.]
MQLAKMALKRPGARCATVATMAFSLILACGYNAMATTTAELYAAAHIFLRENSENWVFNKYDGTLEPLQKQGVDSEGRQIWRGNYTYDGGSPGYVDMVFEQGRVTCYSFFDVQSWRCIDPAAEESNGSPVQAISHPNAAKQVRELMRQSACFRLEVSNKYVDVTQWTTSGEHKQEIPNGQDVSLRNICTNILFVTSDCDVFGRHMNETEAVEPGDTQEILYTCTYSLGHAVVAAHWRD